MGGGGGGSVAVVVIPVLKGERAVLWQLAETRANFPNDAYADWIASHDHRPEGTASAVPDGSGDPIAFSIFIEDLDDDAALARTLRSIEAACVPGAAVRVGVLCGADRQAAITETLAARRIRALDVISTDAADPVASVTALGTAYAEVGGGFVAALPAGSVLHQNTLAKVLAALALQPNGKLIYFDEDWIDSAGVRARPRFKPDWDVDVHYGCDLLGPFVFVDADCARACGGLDPHMTFAAMFDFHTRAAAAAGPVGVLHVAAVCHHAAVPEAPADELVALYLAAVRIAVAKAAGASANRTVEVQDIPGLPGIRHVIWPLSAAPPLVSLIIPTRDRVDLLRNCLSGLLTQTDYQHFEILIIDNGSTEPGTKAYFASLRPDPRIRVLEMPGPFNYSHLNNEAVTHARGDVLLFLNNDVEIIEPSWLREMVSLAVRKDVGAVGARLLYADRRIQHAGVVLSEGPAATHVYRLRDADDAGYDGQGACVQRFLAVTAACLAIRREVFVSVGGFDAQALKIAYNDVDLCLKVHDAGYRVLCTPHARLVHLESASRDYARSPEDIARERAEQRVLLNRWLDRFQSDPFHNRNLLHTWDHGLTFAAPPRG